MDKEHKPDLLQSSRRPFKSRDLALSRKVNRQGQRNLAIPTNFSIKAGRVEIEKNGANVRKALAVSNCSIVQTVSCTETHFRSWRRSSSITFIIDIFSFDQYFRSYREKLVRKT